MDESEKECNNKNYIIKLHLETCREKLKNIYYQKRVKYNSRQRYSVLIEKKLKTFDFT